MDSEVRPKIDWAVFRSAGEMALNKMCADGAIPVGQYLIDVCW